MSGLVPSSLTPLARHQRGGPAGPGACTGRIGCPPLGLVAADPRGASNPARRDGAQASGGEAPGKGGTDGEAVPRLDGLYG